MGALPSDIPKIAQLKERLHRRDLDQIATMNSYFKDEERVTEATALGDAILALPNITVSSIGVLRESYASLEHRVLDELITKIGDDEAVAELFEAFKAEIGKAQERLRFAREAVWEVQKRAIKNWYKVCFY